MSVVKLGIWTVIPNHYQRAFHRALVGLGADVRVLYHGHVSSERQKLGWDSPGESDLLPYEQSVVHKNNWLDALPDWKDRVHVLSGYRTRPTRKLVRRLCASGSDWVHWSEPSHPGWRRALGYPLRRWYGGLVATKALGAFGTGRAALEDFAAWGVRSWRMASLPYVVEPSVIPAESRAQPVDGPTFLFLGQLSPRKGVDVLIHSIAGLVQAGYSPRLRLAGSDTRQVDYRDLASRLRVASAVTFMGPVPVEGVRALLRQADVLVLPSRSDGWGVVISEAVAEGMAVITSDRCGAAHELVIRGWNGFVVRSGSASELAEAMSVYIRTPGLARLHGLRSRDISVHYEPDKIAQIFIENISAWREARRLGQGVAQ